jgi:hypothetical protein
MRALSAAMPKPFAIGAANVYSKTHMPYARLTRQMPTPQALFAASCRRQALFAASCRCLYSRTYATACALRGSRLGGPHLFEESALRDDFSSARCSSRAHSSAALSVPAHAHTRYMLFERLFFFVFFKPAAARYSSLLSVYAAAAAHSIGTNPGAP